MSRVCQICGKKSIMKRKLNKLRGKYNPTPKKKKISKSSMGYSS